MADFGEEEDVGPGEIILEQGGVKIQLKKGSKNWLALFNGSVTPETFFNQKIKKSVSVEVLEEVESAKKRIVALYENTVKDWWDFEAGLIEFVAVDLTKPDGKANINIEIGVQVEGGSAPIWQYVNKGTRPHGIIPTHPKTELKHKKPKKGQKAKYEWPIGSTKPMPMNVRVRSNPVSQTGLPYSVGKSYIRGKPKVFITRGVIQSTAPRNFTKRIVEYLKPQFKRDIENALRRAGTRIARNA